MNLMMLLQMAADGFGDRTAVSSSEQSLTYQQLYEASQKVAGEIRASEAENVGFVDVSSPVLPVLLFGAAWAGRPFVPLNYRLIDSALCELCEQICPAFFVAGEDYLSKLDCVENLTLTKTSEVLNIGEPLAPDSDWDMDGKKEAILLFTSGTTGKPKTAILRHKHLVSYIFGTQEFMSAQPDEASLMALPPYHIAGMTNIISSVYTGRRLLMLPNFDPVAWIDLARSENITHAMLVPTMLWRIAEKLEATGEKLTDLKNIAYGGGKMPIDVVEKALEVFPNTAFVNAYGLTETSSTVSILGPDEHREAHSSTDPKKRQRLNSVGKPIPSMEVSIRNETGKEVSPNKHGEIWVRGDQVSGEYVGIKSLLTEDGWFPTNDAGWINEDGYLFIEGRLDDVIVKGGENISPGEIEDVLHSHEAIMDVAVFGIPDTEWGETIAAGLVLHKGAKISEEEVKDFVRNNLRSSRVPDKVKFLDELPYNETGKLLRRQLKASN